LASSLWRFSSQACKSIAISQSPLVARRLLNRPGMADIFQVDGFRRSLDYHAERHNVLSSNLANSNTPGFRPEELVRKEEKAFGGTLALVRTEGTHFQAAGVPAIHETVISPDESRTGGLDGNTVSIEREMSKLQANDLRYQGASKLVTRHLAMLKYAASDANAG
jgi:flagellar basal-body rod protein FlgB